MARILAIDYGPKRTGIAVTDPLQIITTPLTGLETSGLMNYLEDYFKKEEVELVVVGWPTQDDGSPSNNTPNVEAFIKKFKKKFPHMPVDLQDEWNTSNMAMEALIRGGASKKRRRDKLTIDKLSASIILKSYMESRS